MSCGSAMKTALEVNQLSDVVDVVNMVIHGSRKVSEAFGSLEARVSCLEESRKAVQFDNEVLINSNKRMMQIINSQV